MFDAIHDYDKDINNYPYYAAFKNVNLKVSTAPTTIPNSVDNTKVKVELIDISNGSLVKSQTYETAGATSRTVQVFFDDFQPGHAYQVKYTLLKGNGTKGGLYGKGGACNLVPGSSSKPGLRIAGIRTGITIFQATALTHRPQPIRHIHFPQMIRTAGLMLSNSISPTLLFAQVPGWM